MEALPFTPGVAILHYGPNEEHKTPSPMPEVNQIPHLLRLLDDDSPAVREMVTAELLRFGAALSENLSQSEIILTPEQSAQIHALLRDHAVNLLRRRWSAIASIADGADKLEAALGALGEYLEEGHGASRLTKELDSLADEFLAVPGAHDARALAGFLFRGEGHSGRHHDGLRGVGKEDYYRASNSDLLRVLEEGKGIPISLVSIYILVGKRAGLDIRGCNLPGHFLASAIVGGKPVLVDCFHAGRIIDEDDIASLTTSTRITLEDLLRLECTGEVILARVIRNLQNAYRLTSDDANLQLMHELLLPLSNEEDDPSDTE
jgi:hypothetical protein